MPIFAAVAIAALLGVVVVYAAGLQVGRANADVLRREHKRDVFQDMLLALRDAEACERGFLLTGQEEHLESYQAAVAGVSSGLSRLDLLAKDGSVGRDQADAIIHLSRARLEIMDRNVGLRRQQGLEAAAASVGTGEGRRIMDDLRGRIAQLNAQEVAASTAIRQQRDRATQIRTISAGLISLLLVLFVGWAYWRTRRLFLTRQQAEELVRASEERYRSFFKSAAIGTAQIGPDARLQQVNDRLCQMTGYSRQELLGNTPIMLSAPEAREADQRNLDRFMHGEAPHYEIDKRYRRKDGSIIWVHVSAAIAYDAAGKVLWSSAMIQDITERKAAEERLRESEQRLRLFVEHAPAALAMFDRQMRYLMVSHRWLSDYGLEGRELLGRSHYEVFPEIPQRWKEIHQRALAGEVVRADEDPFQRADGTVQWLRWEVRPWHNDGGDVAGIVVFSENITQQHAAKEARHESEQRLRLAQQAARIGSFDWNIQTGVNTWSPELEAMYGLSPGDFARSEGAWEQLVHPDDRASAAAHVKRAFETEEPVESEWRARWPDGSVHWILGRSQLLRDEAGRPLRLTGVNIDITPRKTAEARLAADVAALTHLHALSTRLVEHEELETVFGEVMRTAAAVVGADRGMLQLLDPESGTLRVVAQHGHQAPFLRFFSSPRRSPSICDESMRRRERVIVQDVEASPLLAGTAGLEVLRAAAVRAVQCTPLIARDGRLLGILTTQWATAHAPQEDDLRRLDLLARQAADLIERARAEAALRQANQTLEQQVQQRTEALAAAKRIAEQARAAAEKANAAKDHFLAVLSHELRTPLTPVLATVSMLQQNLPPSGDLQESLDVICRNVELEARLIDDLLDVTRISRGKVELDKRPVELSTILRRTMEVCQPDIESRRLDFGMDLGTQGPYMVQADGSRLQQVFWNLIKNSIKFTPPGGCVGIRCRKESAELKVLSAEDSKETDRSKETDQSIHPTQHSALSTQHSVVVEVSDSGVGIEPQALSRIFNAFDQGERGVTRQFGGLGLGLTISKAMVEMHGGSIQARSAGKDKGATFTVRLPLLPVEMAEPAQPPPPPPPGPKPQLRARPVRILLVEDHGDTAKAMRQLLQVNGHEVQVAGDVASALDLAGKSSFDLLLSDLGLPDASGLDLMRTLRARGSALPGIALSGYGQDQDIIDSRGAGFIAHLVKPVDLEQLEEAIAASTSHGPPVDSPAPTAG